MNGQAVHPRCRFATIDCVYTDTQRPAASTRSPSNEPAFAPAFCFGGSLLLRRESNPLYWYPALCAAMNGQTIPVHFGLMDCPVCRHDQCKTFARIEPRVYWRCARCVCTFLDPGQLPDFATEKTEYDKHRNDPGDTGYRKFLGRLAEPLCERLEPGSRGLDFGCGPGPVLAMLMRESGHEMELYDPIYAPDKRALAGSYDFVASTEVVEHFHRPAQEFERLHGLLRLGGWLGIMTRFQTDDERFAQWHYRRDPTHVVFYRAATMAWLGRRYGWSMTIRSPGIVLARKTKD
jgi:SAM-dependent methyltransferase